MLVAILSNYMVDIDWLLSGIFLELPNLFVFLILILDLGIDALDNGFIW